MDTFLIGVLKIVFSGYSFKWLRVHSGDFSALFIKEMTRMKSRFWSEDRPEPIMAKWRFQSDEDGFMVQVTGVDFQQVRAMFRKLYGPAEVKEREGSYARGLYRPEDIGLFMRFHDEGDAVMIIAARKPNRI
jgi:hypothetical protein